MRPGFVALTNPVLDVVVGFLKRTERLFPDALFLELREEPLNHSILLWHVWSNELLFEILFGTV